VYVGNIGFSLINLLFDSLHKLLKITIIQIKIVKSNYFKSRNKVRHIYELYRISIRYYSGIIVHIKNNDGGKNGNGICILK